MTRPLQTPVLANSPGYLRFALVLQYFVQGLPFGLFTVALPAYMAERGVSAAAIGGFLGLSFLPWTLKPLWAVLLDRWSHSSMGRRRPWLVFSHAGMLVSLALVLLLSDPLADLAYFTGLCALLAAFTSMQDLATDAIAVELVPPTSQAHANGLMWGSKTLGVATATAAGAWLLNRHGIDATLRALILPISFALLVSLVLREQDGEPFLPWMRRSDESCAKERQRLRWRDAWLALRSATVSRTNRLVALASFTFHLAIGLIGAALPVFAVDQLQWSALAYSRIEALSRLFAGVFVLAFAGLVAKSLGHGRLISWGALLIVSAVVVMAAFPTFWSMDRGLVLILVAYKTVATLMIVIFLATAMGLCLRSIAALQFSLYTAVANLGLALGPLMLGPLHGSFGYGAVSLTAAVLCMFTVMFSRRVDMDPTTAS